jgi:ABC-type polysaccharide/polyol phosphate export permease
MLFLSGVFVPFEAVPNTVQQVAKIFPMTHVTILMRGLWIGQSLVDHLTEIAVLLGILVAGFLVSARIFRWEYFGGRIPSFRENISMGIN